MTDTPTYAPPPPGAPRMDDDPGDRVTDPYLDLDAEARRAEAEQAELHREVKRRVRDIRAQELARAQVAAENAAEHDYTGHYLTRSQLLDLPAPDPLIERVLPRHAYGILRGRDHSLKSFTAVDWACCLATGRPWQGHGVVQAPVLYIAGEGAHGLAARIEAWEYAWGRLVPDTHLTIRKTALDLHQPGPAFDHLLEHIASRGYGLVVVDTLRRVSGAADGNSSEMGRVIDNLDRIKHATHDGTVLAVAHTDKGDHDTRGYSGIEDDADFVWAAKREDMNLTLELTKMKDGPDGTTIHLVANRTLQSLTLAGTGPDGPAAKVDTETKLKILDALRIIPTDTATVAEIRTTAGIAKSSAYRAIADLEKSGHIAAYKRGAKTYYALAADTLDGAHNTTPEHPENTADQELE